MSELRRSGMDDSAQPALASDKSEVSLSSDEATPDAGKHEHKPLPAWRQR